MLKKEVDVNEMDGRDEAQTVLAELNAGEGRLQWQLVRFDEATGRALVISQDCVAQMPYHGPGGPATWEACSLREWLNTMFFGSLPEAIRARTVRTDIVNNDNCSIPGGNDTKDFVFLLSIDEYNEILPEGLRTSRFRELASWWWLRSPGYASTDVANVLPDGSLDGGLSGHGFYSHCDCGGVRPALCLNLL
jgi:hypothetical protein